VSTLRSSFERLSLPAVAWLSGLPRFVPFLVILALMVGGVLIPGWGWVLTLVVVLFLLWTLYLGWPRLDGTQRIMRVTVLLLAAAVMLTQAFPRVA
jgi:hypothetical protein